jgi:di/tricarboxylate transporter
VVQDHFIALGAREPGDRSRLEAVLSADAARERARALRSRLVHLLAALGLPLWLVGGWPGAFSVGFRAFAVTAFGACLAAVLLAAAREWRWQRARAWHIADLGPRPGPPPPR